MYSAIQYTGDGVQTDFAVSFPFISQSHVEVSVAGVSTPIASWPTASTLRMAVAPANGATVLVRRNSSRAARIVDFIDNSTITAEVLDKQADQLLFVAQEALDQQATASYFGTDANGTRVVNVADPLVDTDAATKGWVTTLLGSIATSGLDLRATNNTWAGTNTYAQAVTIGTAQLDPSTITALDMLTVKKGIFVDYTTNHATAIGYGFATNARRESGFGLMVGAQINSWGMGTFNGVNFGAAIETIKQIGATGGIVGLESSSANFNGTTPAPYTLSLDLVFKNRSDGSTLAGDTVGLANNWYNVNSWAMQITAQPRSTAGEYCGWNRGIIFRDQSLDTAELVPYDNAHTYYPGDYVTSGGHRWQCKEQSLGNAPAVGTYWADLGVGTTKDAIGIDFSANSAAGASRVSAAIKLRGQMPIMWDTEELITTAFDPVTGRWAIKNGGVEVSGFDVATGDLCLFGQHRVLTTRSRVSAHRNTSPQFFIGASFGQITFTTKELDDRSEFNTGTGRFTPTTPGEYLVVFQAQSEGSEPAGNRLYSAVFLNGAVYKSGECVTGGAISTALCTCLVSMNGTTDYIDFRVLCTAGGGVSITGEPTGTFLQISKVQ